MVNHDFGGSSLPSFDDTLPTQLGVSLGMSEPSRAQLGASAWADLRRLEASTDGLDLLGVMAACMRHAQSMDIHFRMRSQLELLSVYPQAQSFRCELDLCSLPPSEWAELGLLHVEPTTPVLNPDQQCVLPQRAMRTGQLRLLLWLLALHGSRATLLPEIAEPARFRLSPAVDLLSLPVAPDCTAVLSRMLGRPQTPDELAQGLAMGRPGVLRLLNALYLQSGLIVTRNGSVPWSVERAFDAVLRTIPSGFGGGA